MKLFEFELVVQEEISIRIITHLQLWWLSCSVERDHSGILVEGIMRNICVKLF